MGTPTSLPCPLYRFPPLPATKPGTPGGGLVASTAERTCVLRGVRGRFFFPPVAPAPAAPVTCVRAPWCTAVPHQPHARTSARRGRVPARVISNISTLVHTQIYMSMSHAARYGAARYGTGAACASPLPPSRRPCVSCPYCPPGLLHPPSPPLFPLLVAFERHHSNHSVLYFRGSQHTKPATLHQAPLVHMHPPHPSPPLSPHRTLLPP